MVWNINMIKSLEEINSWKVLNTTDVVKNMMAEKFAEHLKGLLTIKHQDRETFNGHGPERYFETEICVLASTQVDHIFQMLELLKLHCSGQSHDIINAIKDEIKYR